GFGCDGKDLWYTADKPTTDEIEAKLTVPTADRVWHLRYALKAGMSIEQIFALTKIDPWVLDQLKQIVETEEELRSIADCGLRNADLAKEQSAIRNPQSAIANLSTELLQKAKRHGFSDRQLATIFGRSEIEVRRERESRGIKPVYKSVD